MASPYITIAGAMGAGKSHLAAEISKRMGWACFLESAGERNPFLADYYADPPRWAFQSQSFFVAEALSQQREIDQLSGGAVQDRSLWEHVEVFAAAMNDQESLSDRELALLRDLVRVGGAGLGEPDLMIFLDADPQQLAERIRSRGRAYESGLDEEKMKIWVERYRSWTSSWSRSEIVRIPLSGASVGELADEIESHLK